MALTVEEMRTALGELERLMDADFSALMDELSRQSPDDLRDVLLRATGGLLDPYMAAAGELGATWYEELRAASAAEGNFVVRVPELATQERVDALVRWSVAPLYGQSDATVLSLLAGGAQRMISDTARAAVEKNAIADTSTLVGYARVPRPGCCAFCGMLASRGPVYNSSSAAGGVVGRGVDTAANLNADGSRRRGGQARGIRARGSANLGDRFHDRCHCVVTPVFVGGDETISDVVRATEDRFAAMYQQVAAGAQSNYSRRNPGGAQFESVDTKATLAAWRAEFGSK